MENIVQNIQAGMNPAPGFDSVIITELTPNFLMGRFGEVVYSTSEFNQFNAFDRIYKRPLIWQKTFVDMAKIGRLQDLRSEALLLATFDHPYIHKLFYYFEKDSQVNTIYELVPDLNEGLLPSLPGMRQTIKKRIICQVLSGLNYLHTLPSKVFHMNIRPESISFNKYTNKAKIMNFQSARILAHPTLKLLPVTRYFGPEYLSGNFDEKMDIYALGITIIYISTGQQPYGKVNYETNCEETFLHLRVPDELQLIKNQQLRDMVLKCLNPNPSERPSCFDMYKSLTYNWELPLQSQLKSLGYNAKIGYKRGQEHIIEHREMKPITRYDYEDYTNDNYTEAEIKKPRELIAVFDSSKNVFYNRLLKPNKFMIKQRKFSRDQKHIKLISKVNREIETRRLELSMDRLSDE